MPEGAVEDERVRTEFLELFPDFRLVVALRQNTGLSTVIYELHDRFEPNGRIFVQSGYFVLQRVFFEHELVLGRLIFLKRYGVLQIRSHELVEL
ncbi:MAG: hypothetical protein KGJ33_02230 [Patescibacteria group bacterium]|nr:hypothetical protein [Patescibacteria group bacterium]